MPKDLKKEKIKNKEELEEYLLKSLESKKVDTSNSDIVKFVTDYLEELNNFYEEKPIEEFLSKILFEKKYMNKKPFSEHEINFIKNMLNTTNLAKYNDTPLKIIYLLINDISKNINKIKNDLRLKFDSNNSNSNHFQSLTWEKLLILKKEIEPIQKYLDNLKEIKKNLIKNGADIDIKDSCNNSALQLPNNIFEMLKSEINEINKNSIQQINENHSSTSAYKPNSPKI